MRDPELAPCAALDPPRQERVWTFNKRQTENAARLLLRRKWYCKQLHFLCLLHWWCSANALLLQRRPTSLSECQTNARDVRLLAFSFLHSRRIQPSTPSDRISLGGRNGVLNSTGSKHNRILKPLLLPTPTQHILSWLWPDALHFRACGRTWKTLHPAPQIKHGRQLFRWEFSSLSHSV